MIEIMNTIEVKLTHKYFESHTIDAFSVTIENINVLISMAGKRLDLAISGRKKSTTLRKLFYDIYSLFFIYLGSFPRLEEMRENGANIDVSGFVSKYRSQGFFEREDAAVCEISPSTINEDKVIAFRSIKPLPLSSVEYIVSEDYAHIVVTHRITLLLQAIDGLVPKQSRKSVQHDFQKKYKQNANSDYKLAAYFLCRKVFFYYHRKYNCEILGLLGVTQKQFLDAVTDTRHWYTHFLNNNERENRLEGGSETLYYFVLLVFALRVMLVSQVGVSIDEARVAEYYYLIHDWLIDTKHLKKTYKSKTYKICEQFAILQEKLRDLS